METSDSRVIEQSTESGDRQGTTASSTNVRLVPPAVTPVRPTDVTAGLGAHLRGEGRDVFRETIRAFLDGNAAATYTSYRRALGDCLLELAGNAPDDRSTVLVPAFCSSDFPKVIDGVGLDVARYEVDDRTLAADVDDVRDRVNEDTLAVVAVNVLGFTSRMPDLASCCAGRACSLVEALGYGLGATYEGQRLGTFGDVAVCNFQQGKPIPVGGGMVVSQDPTLSFTDDGRPSVAQNAATIAGYAAFGRPPLYGAYRSLSDYLASTGLLPERVSTHPGSKENVEYERPFATMSDFQGAVANRVFERLGDHQRDRALNAAWYARELADVPHVDHLDALPGLETHQWVRYPILVDDHDLRDEIRSALEAAGVHATRLYKWPEIDAERFPQAARLQQEMLTLPTHPYVRDADRRRVVGTITETVRRVTADEADLVAP